MALENDDKPSKRARKTRQSGTLTGSPRGGGGQTRKYPPGLRAAAEMLYDRTEYTQKEIYQALGIPEATLRRWLDGRPIPAHRKGVQGALPEDRIATLEAKVKEQERLIEDYRGRMIQMQRDPLATDELIADLRQNLAAKIGEASVGESAQAISAMLKIKEQEARIEQIAKSGQAQSETPPWFQDFVRTFKPMERPVPTDHDRGIIPEESPEDADGSPIRDANDEVDADIESDSGIPGGSELESDDDGIDPDHEDELEDEEDRAADEDDEL